MATREKNIWILLVFLLAGLTTPIELDVHVMTITFGLWFKMNVASIIGMAIAIFVYRKV